MATPSGSHVKKRQYAKTSKITNDNDVQASGRDGGHVEKSAKKSRIDYTGVEFKKQLNLGAAFEGKLKTSPNF